jgi:hypothetical protein
MGMKTERFGYLYMLFGLLCGFLLGSSLDQHSTMLFRRILSALAILFVAIFWGLIDAKAHTHHLEQWDTLRVSGKRYFILTRYVLLRGTILSTILIGPAITALKFSSSVIVILTLSGLPLIGILLYFGHQEWNECEQEIQIRDLKRTAELILSRKN